VKSPALRLAREAALVLLVWMAIGLFYGSERYLRAPLSMPARSIGWWSATWPHLLRAAAWALLTPVVALLARRAPLGRWRTPWVLPLHAAAALAIPITVIALRFGAANLALTGHLPRFDRARFRETLALGLARNVFTYFGVLGAVWARDVWRRAREARLRALHLRAQLADARLEALRVQLHPHFLFNTLNGIMPLISQEPDAAARMAGQLSELLRLSLQSGGAVASLRAEMEFLRRYLDILEVRFGDHLELRIDLADGTLDASVPHLVLQPLVENALRHGIGARTSPGRLEIRAERKGARLVLEVLDDGPGLPRTDRAPGVGLANTAARLSCLYGDSARLAVSDRPQGGVVARVELPFSLAADPPALAAAS